MMRKNICIETLSVPANGYSKSRDAAISDSKANDSLPPSNTVMLNCNIHQSNSRSYKQLEIQNKNQDSYFNVLVFQHEMSVDTDSACLLTL